MKSELFYAYLFLQASIIIKDNLQQTSYYLASVRLMDQNEDFIESQIM